MEKLRKILQFLFALLGLGLLIVLLYSRYQLGLIRYFDADEFAHLWWSSHFVMGLKPYIDFFYFFPPGFLWFLAPLFVFWSGTGPLTAGRVLMFITFFLTCIGSGLLFYRLRKSLWGAMLAMVILAFLPMPFDKFLEIRPDNPATAFAIFGMLFQVLFFQQRKNIWAFISGIFYAVSLILLPKMLPGIFAAGVIFVAGEIVEGKLFTLFRSIKTLRTSGLLIFILGGLLPGLLTLFYLLILGNFTTVWYSLIKLPLESNKMSEVFIMMPDLFFYPNETFYGVYGWSRGLLTNHVVWLFGIGIAVYRMVTPLFPNGKKGLWNELLLISMLFINAATYVSFIPLKHTQYLIPIAVFIAWYAADGIVLIWNGMKKNTVGMLIFTSLFALMLWFGYDTYQYVNARKFGWTNTQTYNELHQLFATIPKNEYILDLDGRTMYYKSPYIACCIPFGQFAGYLSRPLPSLGEALEHTKAKYIYQGQLERISTLLWSDRGYIGNMYAAFEGRKEIWKRKD
jgi:hypothetical protein